MSILITNTVWGYQVRIEANDAKSLSYAVEALKIIVRKNTRRYFPASRHWFVAKRARKRLDQWLDTMRRNVEGVQIVEDEAREVAA